MRRPMFMMGFEELNPSYRSCRVDQTSNPIRCDVARSAATNNSNKAVLMQSDIILVTGPLVGASSWAPTADRLRAAGARVHVPDVLARLGSAPSWSAWTSHLADLASVDEESILVGHSSASTLVADLATKIPVRGLIIVDGDIPPACGSAPPVRATFRDFIAGLADEDGLLPPWSQWWLKDRRRAQLVGIDTLALDPQSFESFEKDLPRMRLSWFDDVIDLATWDHVPAGYIQFQRSTITRPRKRRVVRGRSGGCRERTFIRL